MATIVQPYSPWREQLLANFLGPIVGNMIQTSQQNAQNKKYNAMMGELAKAGVTQAPQVTPSLFSGMQQQDNPDGWTKAFRQGGNELAAFDANTAITPQVTPSMNPYNQADMMRNYMQLMATPRFASLNPTEAYKIASPFFQALQAQRMTDLRNQYANNLANTGSFDDQINLLARAAMEGAASDDTLRTYAGYAEHRQPHMTFAEMNAGDQIYRLAQNPATGQVFPAFSANVGVSPNTQATLGMQKYGYDLNADLERQRIGLDERRVTEQETQGKYARENPNKNLYITQDRDGNLIGIDRNTGALQPLTRDGQPVKGQPKNSTQDITKSQEIQLENSYKEAQQLDKERKKIEDMLSAYEPSDPEYERLNQRLQQINKRQDEIWELQQGIYRSAQSGTIPSVTPTPQTQTPEPAQAPATPETSIPTITPAPANQNQSGQGNGRWVKGPGEPPQWIPENIPEIMPTPISDDIQPKVPEVNNAPSVMPAPPKAPENSTAKTLPKQNNTSIKAYKAVIKSISPEAEYNPERDKNISQDMVLTPQQFMGLVTRIIEQNPIYSKTANPNVIANKILQQGYKIKF